jgi:branched-subunit amino acid transport protein AzlD
MNNIHAVWIVVVVSVVTISLRFLPFLLFGGKETPEFIVYLGRILPYAIMGMLIVYCLKGITFLKAPYGIPECAASILVIGLHIWKRNTLISIIGGTICYMLLIQLIF